MLEFIMKLQSWLFYGWLIGVLALVFAIFFGALLSKAKPPSDRDKGGED